MTVVREPIPPGEVSTIRGRWQIPALRWVTRSVLVVAILGGLLPGTLGRTLSVVAIAAVVATPLLRIAWLIFRWWQEDDHRFVAMGFGVLAVVAAGALLAAMGVGK